MLLAYCPILSLPFKLGRFGYGPITADVTYNVREIGIIQSSHILLNLAAVVVGELSPPPFFTTITTTYAVALASSCISF